VAVARPAVRCDCWLAPDSPNSRLHDAHSNSLISKLLFLNEPVQMATMTLPSHLERGTAPQQCRFCGSTSLRTFVDLGMSPLCETYPAAADFKKGEVYYPLHVYTCEECFLVQLEEYEKVENIFGDYPYFSSYSDSWLKHCESYCDKMTKRFGLNAKSFVVEVASNDGYLLQYFVRGQVPVLGIEPAANVAKVAVEKGVPTMVRFLGERVAKELAAERGEADLVLGNNVLAQVPDLNDFVEGLKILLKPSGVLTLEFPHLLRLIEWNEFDTIYHEHFSYFSLLTTARILEAHGMKVFDVEELSTHGGSLRIYASRKEDTTHRIEPSVARVIEAEKKAGLDSPRGYERFAQQVRETKFAFVEFLLSAARQGKQVAGYGAPGKSATLLHYCGIGKDLVEYTVDRSPHKQGHFLPGSHIPIYHPDRIRETKPEYVVILPWNLKVEIMEQLQYIREWGGRFVVPIPKVTIS
jgi:SAM-dependent methyltransferase